MKHIYFIHKVKSDHNWRNTQLLDNGDFSPLNNTNFIFFVKSTLQTFIWATLVIKNLHKIVVELVKDIFAIITIILSKSSKINGHCAATSSCCKWLLLKWTSLALASLLLLPGWAPLKVLLMLIVAVINLCSFSAPHRRPSSASLMLTNDPTSRPSQMHLKWERERHEQREEERGIYSTIKIILLISI